MALFLLNAGRNFPGLKAGFTVRSATKLRAGKTHHPQKREISASGYVSGIDADPSEPARETGAGNHTKWLEGNAAVGLLRSPGEAMAAQSFAKKPIL